MTLNQYKTENHEQVITSLIKTEGFLESCKTNIIQYVTTNDTEGLKSLLQVMWQQDNINNFRTEILIKQIKKGNWGERINDWLKFYETYFELGFTSYITK